MMHAKMWSVGKENARWRKYVQKVVKGNPHPRYTANISMDNCAFCNADGDFLVVPQQGRETKNVWLLPTVVGKCLARTDSFTKKAMLDRLSLPLPCFNHFTMPRLRNSSQVPFAKPN